MTDEPKATLKQYLQQARDALLRKLDGWLSAICGCREHRPGRTWPAS
jgi:hypothetical protein